MGEEVVRAEESRGFRRAEEGTGGLSREKEGLRIGLGGLEGGDEG